MRTFMDIAGEIVSGADQSRDPLVRFQALSVSKIETKRPAFAGDFEMDLTGQLSNPPSPLRELLAAI
jgi:hypothetical protein